MKEIPLTKGKVALVDDADFDYLSQWKWRAQKYERTFYAVREVRNRDGTRAKFRMHRVIRGLTDPRIMDDHKDGNGLNNQRYNLRRATPVQNSQNRSTPIHNTSGVTGISWHKTRGKWQAYIKPAGERLKYLGLFDDIEEAKAVRLAAEITYHGQFSATLSRAASAA